MSEHAWNTRTLKMGPDTLEWFVHPETDNNANNRIHWRDVAGGDPPRPGSALRTTAPETPIAALMQCAPFEEPAESALEHAVRVDRLRDLVEDGCLTAREQWVVEATFWRGMGVRPIAAELGLGKSQVWRIRARAIAKLRSALESDAANGQTLSAPFGADIIETKEAA